MSHDRAALMQLAEVSSPRALHVLLHYLYFPLKEDAAKAASELQCRGFRTEERLGADGANWLVLARHEVVPTEQTVADTRAVMEEVTGSRNGEYDGWEAEVRHEST